MFMNSTVFVLGAGASWHYGYPTGEGLVESVISMADRLSAYCEERLRSGQVIQFIPNYVEQKIDPNYVAEQPAPTRSPLDGSSRYGWEKVRNECKILIDRLRSVRPLLIDHFLAWNESLRPIGKLMIAAVILECEAAWLLERANQNRRQILANEPLRLPTTPTTIDITKYRDDWYRFIVHKLVYGCNDSEELLNNDVHFITFNYDTSLEYHLFQALTSIDLLRRAHVEKLLTDDRIIHVYGSVHSQIPTDEDAIVLHTAQNLGQSFVTPLNHEDEFLPRKTFLDRCLAASANLRTIDPYDKEDQESLTRARRWIADSGLVYILGYGFDRNNNHRIGLEPYLSNSSRDSGKSVMFTNFLNLNTVNKSASHLFHFDYRHFVDESLYGDPLAGNYVEKSVRNVYEALEKDFYALEGEPIASTTLRDFDRATQESPTC